MGCWKMFSYMKLCRAANRNKQTFFKFLQMKDKEEAENYVPNNKRNLLITGNFFSEILAQCCESQIDFRLAGSEWKKHQNHDKKRKKLLMKLLILSIIILSSTPAASLCQLRRKYLFSLSDEMNTLQHGSKVERHVIVVCIIKSVLLKDGRSKKKELFRRFFLFHYAINIL